MGLLPLLGLWPGLKSAFRVLGEMWEDGGCLPASSLGTKARTGRQGCAPAWLPEGGSEVGPLRGPGASRIPLRGHCWAVGRGTPEDTCPLSFSHLGSLLTTGREAAAALGTLGSPGCLSGSKVTASLISEVSAGAATSAPGHPLLSPRWPACSSKASDAAAHPPAVRPKGRGWQGPS